MSINILTPQQKRSIKQQITVLELSKKMATETIARSQSVRMSKTFAEASTFTAKKKLVSVQLRLVTLNDSLKDHIVVTPKNTRAITDREFLKIHESFSVYERIMESKSERGVDMDQPLLCLHEEYKSYGGSERYEWIQLKRA
jgi:hypothetical protein